MMILYMNTESGHCQTVITARMSDSELVNLILAGDILSIDILFGRYEGRARAIAKRFLICDESRIQDVVQESTMKAYLNLNKLRDRDKFGSWFLRIVRNMAVDSAQGENIYAPCPNDVDSDFESWASKMSFESADVPERFFTCDLIELVRDELGEIDSMYSDPLRMRYFDELSYSEIAEILDKPVGTIKSLIHRAKSILRERIDAKVGVRV